jgi:hypothetical protein
VVDVSTSICDLIPESDIESRPAIHQFLCALEAEPHLLLPQQLVTRLIALDKLDAILGDIDMGAFAAGHEFGIRTRAHALRNSFEAANTELYNRARSEIVCVGYSRTLHQWLLAPADDGAPRSLGFDLRDEIVSGVLQFCEPASPDLAQSREMVPYQPTPVRHILDLIASSGLSQDDILVDLGSGLGHVPLLVSILAGIRTLGIEFQPAYVASSQQTASNLRLREVRFVAGDARFADLSSGTVFYLYSPFTGTILAEVLSRLQKESTARPITVCSLGPCTRVLQNQRWLQASAQPDTERMTVFKSR